jgi:hypothetical protein
MIHGIRLMKINTLLEYTSPSSQPNQAGGQAPEFGRDPNVLETTTGSGSVATVSNPVGGMQRRNSKGSMFQGIKTSKKFVNSPVTEDEISEEQLLTKELRKELFKRAKDRDIGNRPENHDIMSKESDPEYDDEAGMATTNLHTALRAVEGLNKVIGPNENLPEWVQEKIAIANDYLVTCWDYMISQHEQGRKYEVDENQDWMKDIAAMAHKMAPQDKMRERQAQRDAQAKAEQQQRLQQDVENLPDLISQYNDMEAEYESMGGSNWQYADREQNLSDKERKARGMETSMRHLANRIHAAKKASEGLAESKPDFGKMFDKKIGKHNKAVVKTKKEIGTRVADIGAGGKEYNVKTDKEWDKQQGVAEGSESSDNLVSTLNSFGYYSDNGDIYVNDSGDKIARQGSNWKHQSGKRGIGAEELGEFLGSKQGVAEGYQLDEGAVETITALVKKIPGIGKYYQMAQQYKPQLIEILKTSKSGKEVKQKMEQLAAGQSATVAESGMMKQLGGLAVGGGSILSTMWMNAMGMIDGVLAHAAAGEVGGAVASGSILGLIPVTLMLFAAMLLFKGSKQSSDEKAQAFQAQRGQQGVAETAPDSDNRQWSNKDMERLRVATKDFDDIMASDAYGRRINQDVTKQRLKTKPIAGPKGVLPEQGMGEGTEQPVSFREMVNVVDQHYPKYYAELSGSDISDKQFERAIVNAYKKIMQKQGMAEGMEGSVVFSGTGDNGGKYEIIQSGPNDFMIHANGKHIDSYDSLQRAMSVLQNEVPGLKKTVDEESKGLWANIHAKRERIKQGSGEKMRKPGSTGAPTADALRKSAK